MRGMDFALATLVAAIFAIILIIIPPRDSWPRSVQLAFAIAAGLLTLLFSSIFHSIYGRDPVAFAIEIVKDHLVCPLYAFSHCEKPDTSARPQEPKPTPPRSVAEICPGLPNIGVKVRLVPDLSNFQKNDLSRLEKLVDCVNFSYSTGESGRFPDKTMNALAYRGVFDYRIIKRLTGALGGLGVQVEYICNQVGELADDYILLGHYGFANDRPLAKDELGRIASSNSQSEFNIILGTHVCHGPWPIAVQSPARRRS